MVQHDHATRVFTRGAQQTMLSKLKPTLLRVFFCMSSAASLNANSANIVTAASAPLLCRASILIFESKITFLVTLALSQHVSQEKKHSLQDAHTMQQ